MVSTSGPYSGRDGDGYPHPRVFRNEPKDGAQGLRYRRLFFYPQNVCRGNNAASRVPPVATLRWFVTLLWRFLVARVRASIMIFAVPCASAITCCLRAKWEAGISEALGRGIVPGRGLLCFFR